MKHRPTKSKYNGIQNTVWSGCDDCRRGTELITQLKKRADPFLAFPTLKTEVTIAFLGTHDTSLCPYRLLSPPIILV